MKYVLIYGYPLVWQSKYFKCTSTRIVGHTDSLQKEIQSEDDQNIQENNKNLSFSNVNGITFKFSCHFKGIVVINSGWVLPFLMTICGNSEVSIIERVEEYVRSLKGSLNSVIGTFCLIGQTNQITTIKSIKYFWVLLKLFTKVWYKKFRFKIWKCL